MRSSHKKINMQSYSIQFVGKEIVIFPPSTLGQKLSLRTKLSFEIEPSWKIKPEIGHRKMDEELQNLRNFAESAGNTGGIERNSLGVLENGLGVLKNSADIDKIEEELSEIKESLANQGILILSYHVTR